LTDIDADLEILVCNNDNGDGIALFNNNKTESSYIVFNGKTSTWKSLNRDIFPDSSTNNLAFALDCARSTENGSIVAAIGGWDNTYGLVGCGSITPMNPGEVSNLVGSCRLNRFPTQGEYYHTLSWVPSDTNVVAQNIYRNGILIDTVGVSTSSFVAHNQQGNAQLYDIRDVAPSGILGPEVSITVVCD
jgi:hypothetical protein